MKDILGFQGDNRFLSNFWPAEVELDGIKYKSTEHAYQAAKTTNVVLRQQFQDAVKPGDTKRLGAKLKKENKIREDWDKIKLQVMEDLIRQKFTNHKDLKEKLLATGNAYLEETNNWRDIFWGVCNGKGENHLGKILMKIRKELQNKYEQN